MTLNITLIGIEVNFSNVQQYNSSAMSLALYKVSIPGTALWVDVAQLALLLNTILHEATWHGVK